MWRTHFLCQFCQRVVSCITLKTLWLNTTSEALRNISALSTTTTWLAPWLVWRQVRLTATPRHLTHGALCMARVTCHSLSGSFSSSSKRKTPTTIATHSLTLATWHTSALQATVSKAATFSPVLCVMRVLTRWAALTRAAGCQHGTCRVHGTHTRRNGSATGVATNI